MVYIDNIKVFCPKSFNINDLKVLLSKYYNLCNLKKVD